MATGVALLPESGAMYNSKPIPPDYAWVDVTWTNKDFDEDKIDIPIEDGYRFISAIIGMRVLWNKSDIVLDMPTPVSQPSHPLSSPLGDLGDNDDDDNGDAHAHAQAAKYKVRNHLFLLPLVNRLMCGR